MMAGVVLVALAVGAALAAGRGRRGGGGDASAREEEEEVEPGTVKDYGRAGVLLELLGAPYWWGGHESSAADKDDTVTSWGEAVELLRANATGWGLDCSLFANLAWEVMGIRRFVRRTSKQLAWEDCEAVEWGKQRPGDLAYYPGHVMVVLSYPTSSGDSEVIGASGGGSATKGTDPNARVKVFGSARYRADFVTFMRLKKGVV